MRLLLTRPLPEAETTAERLRAAGHAASLAPMQRAESLALPLGAGGWHGLVVTSPRAVAALRAHPERDRIAHLPAHAVGEKTAKTLRAAGFRVETVALGSAEDLGARLAATLPPGTRLLHLAGEEIVFSLAPFLARHDIGLHGVTVYRMAPATELPEPVIAALQAGEIDAALHYSARAAEILAGLCQAQGLDDALARLDHYCLSARIAAALGKLPRPPHVAQAPNETALLALLR